MAWSFNPFTGNLDIVGGGAVVFEGEVETFADLSETIGDPAVGASFLVRSSTGVWLVNRRQAGIWIRKNNTGVRATDWEYGGDYPVNSVNGQTGNVSLGSSDVAAEPIDYTVVTSATTLANGAKVAADTTAGAFTLTLPATPSNGDTVTVLDYAGTFDTNNLTIARNGSNIESLAEDLTCNVEDAAFTLVFVGSTVGWKVVPYFGNKTNFASPDPIGSSVPNTGRFTTLTANNGTLTGASAPVLDLSQTWNNAATTFTGLRLNVTNTASGAASFLTDWQVGGTHTFGILTNGTIGRFNTSTGATRAGIFFNGQSANRISVVAGDSLLLYLAPDDFGLAGGAQIRWDSSGGSPTGTGVGLALLRDGANHVLGQRVGTNAQTFNIYNTFTSATNHERGFLRWSSNVFQIGTEKGSGGGSARNIEFHTDNTFRARIQGEGLVLSANSSNVYFGNPYISGAAESNVSLDLVPFGSGNVIVRSGLLKMNGTTSSFPALKRSSAVLQARLADDSGYTVLDAQLRSQGTAPATSGATGTAGDIRYDADYIYVCTATNTWKRAAIATW